MLYAPSFVKRTVSEHKKGREVKRVCLLFIGMAIGVAHAASFNCAKATTTQEKAICASPALSQADDEMAAAYKAWLEAARPEWSDGIRSDQRTWLRVRAGLCTDDHDASSYAACLMDAYRSRINDLRGRVQQRAGVTFLWRAIVVTARDDGDSNPMGATEVTPGSGTLQASWPQATAPTPQWTAWNKAVEAFALKVAQEDRQPEVHEWKDAAQPGVDQETTVTIDNLSGQLISASVSNFVDGHGAHPGSDSTVFHWLLDKQRELVPEDVFRTDSAWAAWMEHRIDTYLHKALDSSPKDNYQSFLPPGEMLKQLRSIVAHPAGWEIDRKGITIFFNPYEVACYACTPPPVTIPWTEMKAYLNPSFEVPR